MRILAVDTASRTCSVAVAEENVLLAEFTINHRDTHSRFLMEMIDRVLTICRLTIRDVDGFAVTLGPGSFTGLRIGLSTVKGLAAATEKPVVGVGSLEALAFPFSGSDRLICPLLDARRHEVYAARYRFDAGRMIVQSLPQAVSPELAVNDITEPCLLVGDGAAAYRDRLLNILGNRAVLAHACHHPIRGAMVAALAMPRFQSGDTDDADTMTPFYIRPSDAMKMRPV